MNAGKSGTMASQLHGSQRHLRHRSAAQVWNSAQHGLALLCCAALRAHRAFMTMARGKSSFYVS